ncbi:hypothetical protein ACS0TY_029014 [Phlomoides rotata]
MPISLLNSCSSLKQLLQIHAQIIISGLHHNSDITDKIIQFCTSDSTKTKRSIGFINHAHRVVSLSQKLESCPWNSVIRAYATSNSNSQREAIMVFLDMRRLGVESDEYTFPFLFKSCASFAGLFEGRQIHGDAMKLGYHFNVYVQNSLIHFYGSCKKLTDSCKVFDEMSHRTSVSWNSIVSAHVDCYWFYECLELFVRMRNNKFEPDETSMVIVLSACAELGNLSLGKMVNRNVWTWSSMIHGFAQHGFARSALKLFKEMRNHSIRPNHVTFLGVLCACSHAGLVYEGQCYFNEMEQVYRIKPMMVHYGAMVDILGRAGRLEEAHDFVMNMPIEADGVVWRALLSSCSIHDVNDYTGVGEKVRRRLIELEPKRSGNLVMIANKYAEVGLWEKAEHLRSKMRDKGLKKIAGESCLEIAGTTFRFLSGDYSCVGCTDIFLLLKTLNLHTEMIRFE